MSHIEKQEILEAEIQLGIEARQGGGGWRQTEPEHLGSAVPRP